MITINNVLMPDETRKTITREYHEDITIDGSNLLALPGLIDPHVHFRVPGLEDKEDWQHASIAAIKGGYTTVFDMPNTKPATTTKERLDNKFQIINQQLSEVDMPLRYKLFFGADKNQFHEIVKVKDDIVGIKVFMGASTGDLLMDDESSLHAIYALAKVHGLIIALHAEDELIIRNNAAKYADETDFKYHSIIREPEAAVKAVDLVIKLTEIYGVTSYILHLSTIGELELVKKAKERGLPVFVETCPHYLFLDESMYPTLNGRGKMNPPLRTKNDQDILWNALNDGVIDTIGSDHAPHKLGEKEQPLCKCPSGVPGIETTLPLMLTAWKQNKVKLSKVIELTHANPQKIFSLAKNDDLVLVDIVTSKILTDENMATKCKWTPFVGMELIGFPRFVFTQNRLIDCEKI
ncbi:MAG: dihydroorotase [Burkholderiales bacterium]|nr:dihydroorotase [Burkholderiales bacterium]